MTKAASNRVISFIKGENTGTFHSPIYESGSPSKICINAELSVSDLVCGAGEGLRWRCQGKQLAARLERQAVLFHHHETTTKY